METNVEYNARLAREEREDEAAIQKATVLSLEENNLSVSDYAELQAAMEMSLRPTADPSLVGEETEEEIWEIIQAERISAEEAKDGSQDAGAQKLRGCGAEIPHRHSHSQ